MRCIVIIIYVLNDKTKKGVVSKIVSVVNNRTAHYVLLCFTC